MALSRYPRVLSGLNSVYSLCKQSMNEFSVTLSLCVTEVTAKAKKLKMKKSNKNYVRVTYV